MSNEHFLWKTKDLQPLRAIGVPTWCIQQNISGQAFYNAFDYYGDVSGRRQKQIDTRISLKSKIHLWSPYCKFQEQI